MSMRKKYSGSVVRANPVVPTEDSAPGIWTLEQQNQNQKKGTWPFIGDPSFKNTTLLLHGDTSQAPSKDDQSGFNQDVEIVGDAKATNFSPYNLPDGYWSNFFDGSSDFEFSSSTDFNITTYVTFECWVYFPTFQSVSNELIAGREANYWLGYNYTAIGGTANKFVFTIHNNSSWQAVSSSTTPTANTWYHIMGVKDGTTLRFYLNGTQENTATFSGSPRNSAYALGVGGYDGGSESMTGYVSNVRLVTGSSDSIFPYSLAGGSSFTPPSTPLISTGSATKLITCQSNRLVDNSADARTMTANGEPNVQPFSPFSYTPTATVNTYGSYYFDGTGDYLTVENDVIDIGYDPFTVEIWAYLKDSSSFCPLWGISNGAGGALKINLYDSGNGSLTFENSGGGGNFSTDTGVRDIMNNAWAHIVFVREGTGTNQSHIYVNGVVRGTGTVSGNLTGWTGRFRFARNPEDYSSAMAGYISNARIIKNKALYTSAFTPPTKPIELTLTEGENSVYFDGSNDYLTVPNSTNTNIGGYSEDYTINCWFNLGTITSAHRVLFGMSNGGGAQNKWLVGINMSSTAAYSANKVGIYSYANSSARGDGTYSPGFLANSWYYFTLVYTHSNTTLKIYINGTEVVSVSSNVDSSTGAFTIGTDGEQNGDFIGYISNFRLVKGHALSAAVPEVPFDVTSGTVLLACASRYLEDRSPEKLNITNVDATISQFNPFNEGYWSVHLDSISDKIQVATASALPSGTADRTVEFWAKVEGSPSSTQYFFGYGSNTGGGNFSWARNGSGNFAFFGYGTGNDWATSTAVPQDEWFHVSVTSNGSQVKFYLNGTLEHTQSYATNTASVSNLYINQEADGSGFAFANLKISNFILYSSVVRTGNFTAPTVPETDTTNVVLLVAQSNRPIDNSSNSNTVTFTGATIDEDIPFTFLKRQTKLLNLQNNQSVGNNSIGNTTAFKTSFDTNGSKPFQGTFSPFSAEEGKWSVYLDGSGDYFVLTDNVDLEVGSNDFTFEVWYLPLDVTTNNQTLCDFGSQGAQASIIPFYQNGSSLVYYVTTSGGGWNTASGVSYGGTFVAGQWHHLALVRHGNTITPYFNGVAGTTATISGAVNNSAVNKYIGAFTLGTGVPTGYISNFRLVNGAAVYTSAFTPPTKPIENPIVNGEQSVYFDGNGDRLTVVGGENIGTGDFTISAWVYRTSSGTYPVILDTRSSDSDTKPVIYTDGSNLYYYTAGAIRITGSSVIINNVWHFVRLVRSSGVTKLFLDGSQVGSDYSDSNNYAPTNDWEIGSRHTNQHYWYGYISNLQFVLSALDGTSVPTAPFTADANTKLLTCQSKSFVDESDSDNAITANGDAAISYFNPFNDGYWSFYSDGAGHINSGFTLTDTGSYTYEGWVKPTADNSGYAAIFATVGNFSSFPGVGLYANNSSPPRLHVRHGGTTQEDANGQLAYNTWYFVKVVYDSSAQTLTTFLDGTQIYQNSSVSANAQGSNACLFYQPAAGNQKFHGYISNWRFRPVVDSSTTVPTEPFDPSVSNTEFLFQSNRFVNNGSKTGTVAITGTVAVDENIPFTLLSRQTKLLICQSNHFKDEANSRTITVYGTPKVYPYAPFAPSRSYSKEVVGGSAFFDATTGTGFTSLDNVPGCAFGTGDFTVEVWIYNIDGGVNGQIVSNRDTGSSGNANQWSLEFWSATTPRTLEWHDGLTAGILTATGVYPNQWNHIAVARSGTTSKMFVNGVEKSSATDSRDYSNVKRLNIGDEVNFTGASPFKGYIGPLRILKGTCLYTSAFTPPTSLFTEITNTEILINFTNGAVIDNTGKNNLETIDDARVSLQVKKFGNGSMYFDGTTDKMILPHSELQQLNTGQFTVELFVYFTATDARQGFFGNDGGWYFQIYDGELEFALGVSAIIERTFSHSLNQWYHLAATRDSSNNVRLFIDGTQQGAVVNSTANLRHNSNVFHIGNIGPNTTRPFKGGYMDEIRITKGVARYITDFTAPTRAFKNR